MTNLASRYIVAGILSLGAIAVSLAVPAPGFAVSAELKCQDTIALQGRNYFKNHYTAVSKCEQKKSAGDLPQSTNCRPSAGAVTDTKTADKLQDAATKLGDQLDSKCTDPMVAGLTIGLPCGTVATVTELTDCIVGDAHGASADMVIGRVFDDAGELTHACVGGDNDGLPCDPKADLATECPNGGTECRDLSSLRLCQKAMAGAARNYAKDRMTARRGCARKLMDGKIEPPCPDEKTNAKLAKALEKLRKKVLKKCTDAEAEDAAMNLGYPCESFLYVTFERDPAIPFPPTNLIPPVERLVRCIGSAVAGDGDLGANTAYPLPDAPPFSYGIAAGDATNDSFIAWTRTDGPGEVTLDVATDADFTTIVQTVSGLTPNVPGDNTVKYDVTGLAAGTAGAQYYYRFTQGGNISRTGRIRTAPLGEWAGTVSAVWTGDAKATYQPFTTLDHIVADDPDLWFYIGDTVIADEQTATGAAFTREEFQTKYKENWSDRSLRDVLAAVGTVAGWDDHEVTNDFWGTNPDPTFQQQMANGFQAFRDYMPVRENPGDPNQIYRTFRWGSAVEFFLIDPRQYRNAPAYVTEPDCLIGECETSLNPCRNDSECDPSETCINLEPEVLPGDADCLAEIAHPGRTYLGATQKQWLKDGLLNSTATFKVIINAGPMISQLLFLPFDRWEGYSAERTEMLNYITSNNIKNVIFLSGDIHAAIVNGKVVGPPAVRELTAGGVGRESIYRELPESVLPLVPTMPLLFPTVTHFDMDRNNYGLVEISPTAFTLSYYDNTGAVIHHLTYLAE